MRENDLLLAGGAIALLLMARNRGPRGSVSVDYDAGEASEVFTPARKPSSPSSSTKPSSPSSSTKPSSPSSSTKPSAPSSPPPIPDVESPPSRAGLERINVATAELVLRKLGAEDVPQSGVFNLEAAQAWQEATIRLDPLAPGQGAKNLDPVFERASNTKVWIDPKTAARIAEAANKGNRVLAPDFDADSGEGATGTGIDPEVQKRVADQVARDAMDAAKRAAQIAAQSGAQEDLSVQTPVPAIPLPNPAPSSPPTPINLERARRTAPLVDRDVKSKRDKYDRKLVAQFQADSGLVPDGLYGPVTQSALRYFGVRDPATPVFRNKNFTAYQPPA